MDRLGNLKYVITSGCVISPCLQSDVAKKLKNWTIDIGEKIQQMKDYFDSQKDLDYIFLILLAGDISKLVGEKARSKNYPGLTSKIDVINKIIDQLPLNVDLNKYPWATLMYENTQMEIMEKVLSAITFKN
jgi:hypothetical protein